MNEIFQTKVSKLPGTRYAEVYKKAFIIYKEIKRKTKRRPYIHSAYFKKDKIFLELFWIHLFEKKNIFNRMRRLKYFLCGIELIKNCKLNPISKENPNKKSEILHRFTGASTEKEIFYVQIKEDKRTGQKWLMSIFPEKI